MSNEIPLASFRGDSSPALIPTPIRPVGMSSKSSYFDELPKPIAAEPRAPRWTWSDVDDAVWASLPVLAYALAIGTLGASLFQLSYPYFTVAQVGGGTGKIEYGVLQACATAPNTTTRTCSAIPAIPDFSPSLIAITSAMPGFTVLSLPIRSPQTPVLFLVAFISLLVSFTLYLPIWVLAFFPTAFDRVVTRRVLSFVRYYPKAFHQVAGVLAFASMIFTIVIGLGWKLQLITYRNAFGTALQLAVLEGQVGVDGTTMWEATIGSGFELVWATCVFVAISAFAVQVSIHQAVHERVERYGEAEDARMQPSW